MGKGINITREIGLRPRGYIIITPLNYFYKERQYGSFINKLIKFSETDIF